jgi:lipoprotein-anchoring transpeptidase ErfK/SrfK
MKLAIAAFVSLFLLSTVSFAEARYGRIICNSPDYKCKKVRGGQTWYSLFPDDEARDIVMRLNRTNTRLRSGQIIAVPHNLHQLTVWDISPFPRYIEAPGEKTIYVSQQELAWAAYSSEGELLWWGPISSGRDWCGDVGEGCQTPHGEFRMIRKQGIECESSKFPIETNGGAPMPYCMHFYRGFALHGSAYVTGKRSSHGCVRMFVEDARWLNQEFINLPGEGGRGTRIVIGPV